MLSSYFVPRSYLCNYLHGLMVRREMAIFSIDSLPRGYRFCPTDVELVNHYLKRKNSGQSRSEIEIIPEIDICKCEPWDVPAKSLIKSSDSQWYFFCPKDRKYPNSNRSNRATEAGYWKVTGRDRMIKDKPYPAVIGTKKTLVFYRGRASNGVRTNWVIHEYRLPEPERLGEQNGFVLCRLFKKPGERTSISDVDDCMERNPQTVQNNSILSPAPTMLPPDSDTVGISVEPAAPADHNFPVFDLQENVQPLPQASDMQTSGENYELLPDEASNNPSNPDVTHVTGSVRSDVAPDHEFNETTWVDYLKDYLPELVVPEFDDHGLDGFHINSPLLTDTELAFCDPDSVGQKFPPGLYQCHSAEEDIVTEFINSVLCDPDECLHDASNPLSSSWKLDPEDQSFVCPDISHRDSFSVKEMQTGLVEEKDATISNERVEFSGETCKLLICSSSSQQNNYIDPTKRGMNQFSFISDQNLSQDISFVEATTSSSHQVSSEMDNLDSAIIRIRTHKNSSNSECLMEQQGLARRRLCLQKLVHKESPPRTDHVSNTTNGDVVISVVNEAREIVELQCGEEKLKDVASHDEPASTGIQYSSSNILRRRARCVSKDKDLFKYCELDEVTTPSASHCTSTAIMILSALLFLIFIGLSWRLSS